MSLRDLLVILIVVGSVPFILKRPWIGVLMWYWVSLMNPHKLGWGGAAQFPVALIVALATLGSMFATKERYPIGQDKGMILLGTLMLYFTFTTMFAWVPDVAWSQWKQVLKIILMTFVTVILISGREKIRWLMLVIACSVGFYGVKGGIFTLTTGGGSRVYGPGGTFIADNNHLGLALIMIAPVILYIAFTESHRWVKRGLYLMFVLSLLTSVFTYSRGALVGLACIVLAMAVASKRKILVIMLIIPIGAGALYQYAPEKLFNRAQTIKSYKDDNSAMQRIQAWGVAYNIAKEHPFTGAGFRMYFMPAPLWLSYANFSGPAFDRARAEHSIYFQVLGQHGFVALALFLLMLYGLFSSLGQVAKRAGKQPELLWLSNYATGLRLGLIGYSVSGVFLNLAYFDLIYVFVALACIFQRELNSFEQKAMPDKSLKMPLRGRAYPATNRKT